MMQGCILILFKATLVGQNTFCCVQNTHTTPHCMRGTYPHPACTYHTRARLSLPLSHTYTSLSLTHMHAPASHTCKYRHTTCTPVTLTHATCANTHLSLSLSHIHLNSAAVEYASVSKKTQTNNKANTELFCFLFSQKSGKQPSFTGQEKATAHLQQSQWHAP